MLQIKRNQGVAHSYIPDFGDPLGLLVHCHAKIEAQLRSLERAADVLRTGEAKLFPAVRGAVSAAQAHFAGPGVKHTADEEESLFPRLCTRRLCGESGVLEAIEALEAQHVVIERAHAEVDAAVERLAFDGTDSPGDVEAFSARIATLIGLYLPHIALENDVVFRAAARVLPPEELAALGQEMRRRRGM